MKKVICIFISILMLLSVFGIAAFAKEQSAAVEGMMIPFEIETGWYVSMPGSVDAHFLGDNGLKQSYYEDFMALFHYRLWLKNARDDNEIILTSEPADDGAKDYSAMSDGELQTALTALTNAYAVTSEVTVGKTSKFRSGSLLFLRYEIILNGGTYTVFYNTVNNGVLYEIRLQSPSSKVKNASVSQTDNVVNDLAAALTFPENYPTAPVPSVTEKQPDAVLDIETGEISVPETSNTTESQPEETFSVPSPSPESTTAAAESVTFRLDDYTPQTKKASSAPVWIFVAAGAATAAVIAAVVIIVKKKRG